VNLRFPLDRVYIRLQAVEEKRQRQQEAEERRALEAQIEARRAGSPFRDILGTLRLLGEYFYRRGQVYQAEKRPEPVDPQEALEKHPRLVILGAPGAGKSTLLRFLARRAAEDEHGPLPILVSLRDYATALAGDSTLSLREFALRREAGGDGNLRRALEAEIEAGRVLWLVDALDEARGWSGQAARQVGQLKGRLVVTSRILECTRSLEMYPGFEVLPLNPENADDFLQRWFGLLAETRAAGPEWVAGRADWLKAQLQARPRLRPLARSPLLLTFLAVLAGEDPQRELPAGRAELYRRYVEELLDSWEAWRYPREGVRGEPAFVLGPLSGALARRAALDCFYYLGWALHLTYYGGRPHGMPDHHTVSTALAGYLRDNCEWATATAADLQTVAKAAIEFWQEAGLFELDTWRLNGDDREALRNLLAFRHLTFGEYAAAWALERAWRQDSRRTWAFLRPRLHHYAWREPLLLLAGLLDTGALAGLVRHILAARSPYERHLHRDLRLAAAVLGEWPDPDARVAQRVVNRLEKISRSSYSRDAALAALVQAGRPALPTLLRALGDRDLGVRWMAVEALRQMGDPQAIPTLLRALGDRDSGVRQMAVEALRRIGGTQAVPALLRAIEDSESHVRRAAVEALGEIGDPQAVSALLRVLEDNVSDVRHTAARVLGEIGDPQTVPALLQAIEHRELCVRWAAAEALGQMGGPQAIPAVLRALENRDSGVRQTAVKALGRIGDPQTVPALLRALEDSDSDVRHTAVGALGEIGDPQAICALFKVLEDSDSDVRHTAAEALGRIGAPQAVPALLQALGDSGWGVQQATVEALGRIGDPKAVPALLRSLEDSEPDVRTAAARALGEIGDRQAVPALIQALGDTELGVSIAAAEALGEIGDPQAVPALIRALGSSGWGVSQMAVAALRQMGDPQTVPALLWALGNCDSGMREAAAKALGGTGDLKTVPALLQALEDSESGVRIAAAYALREIGNPQAIPALLRVLGDGNWYVRRIAAEALMQTDDPQTVPVLLRALDDSDSGVRRSAVKALGRIGDPQTVPALLRALGDSYSDVCLAAAEALGKIGDSQAVPALLRALRDGNSGVRVAAAEALGQIPGALDSIPHARQAAIALRRHGEQNALEDVTNRLAVLEAGTARAPAPPLPAPPIPAWRRAIRWLARAGGLALAALAFAVLSNLLADQLKVSVPLPLQLLLLLALAAVAVAMVEALFQQWKV